MTFREKLSDMVEEPSRAVSPVIGVILMVAITVILAAVIGTFVMGLGNNVDQNANAGVAFDQGTESGNNVVDVQLNTLGNVEKGSHISVSCTADSNCDDSENFKDSGVGQTITIGLNGNEVETGDEIVVTAEIDGSENVIQRYTAN